jgi:hypothetical protein
MLKKFCLIHLFLLTLISLSYSQIIQDSTFVLDGQLNCISPIDINHNNFKSAVVGAPVYSNLLLGNGIYQITISGQVTIDGESNKMPGVLVMYIDANSGDDEEIWTTMTPSDTIEFVVAQSRERYFHAVLFDPEDVSDNSGQYHVNLKLLGWVYINEEDNYSIREFELEQNYPNPFNSSTTIKYNISKNSYVKIEIFNTIGQKIETLVDEVQMPNDYTIRWNVSDKNALSSGLYFYQINVDNRIKSRRMIYIK